MPAHPTPEELIKRYLDGSATPEEKALVESWHLEEFRDSSEHPSIPEIDAAHQHLRSIIAAHAGIANNQEEAPTQHQTRRLWPRIAAAAASVILIAGAAYLFINKTNQQPNTTNQAHDVAPFSAAVILKTQGRTIILDKTANGNITGNISKAGEQLTYNTRQTANNQTGSNTINNNPDNTQTSKEITASYDTIQVPAGGRPYTLKLTDGSRITLNAATTLRYPNNKRAGIELISGEIYAEIVHDTRQPITIKAPGQLIHDIGTELNIDAYSDEPEKRTTLIEGSISVNSITLRPGQQALNGSLNKAAFNLEQTVAWKKGDFNFRGEHLDVIMRELARWYNITVVYQGKMTDETFYFQISRKRNISAVLKAMEGTNKVKFKIEGRRVTVLSKH